MDAIALCWFAGFNSWSVPTGLLCGWYAGGWVCIEVGTGSANICLNYHTCHLVLQSVQVLSMFTICELFLRDAPANVVEYHSMGAPWCSVMKRKTQTLLT